MLAKKNQKYDLRKNSTLFFSLGLLCMTFFAYFVMELQVEKINLSFNTKTEKAIDLIEEPVVYLPKQQEVITIKQKPFVDNFIEVDNTIITEPIDIKPVVNIPTLESDVPRSKVTNDNIPVFVEPVLDISEVPFINIEDTPIFPGCENLSKTERDNCFREKILNHIKKNLRYPEHALENDHQDRIHVQFIIEKDGSISIANLRGKYESLNKEATRVIKSLPKIKPGEQRKKPVKVSYTIPIVFKN